MTLYWEVQLCTTKYDCVLKHTSRSSMKTAKMLLYAGKREFAHTKNEWKIDAGKLMQITTLYWEVRLKNTTLYYQVRLCTTNYDSVLFCTGKYGSVLQSTTLYYKVRLCTTKCESVLQYDSVLQSTIL